MSVLSRNRFVDRSGEADADGDHQPAPDRGELRGGCGSSDRGASGAAGRLKVGLILDSTAVIMAERAGQSAYQMVKGMGAGEVVLAVSVTHNMRHFTLIPHLTLKQL